MNAIEKTQGSIKRANAMEDGRVQIEVENVWVGVMQGRDCRERVSPFAFGLNRAASRERKPKRPIEWR